MLPDLLQGAVLPCSLAENEVRSNGPYGDPRKVESVPNQLPLYIGREYIHVFYTNRVPPIGDGCRANLKRMIREECSAMVFTKLARYINGIIKSRCCSIVVASLTKAAN